jgi:NET1-associated nuclear protein 1 (U3 small nucleolar RNA-associated protein 17)
VGTYKNLPLHTGAFSPDGSLLAISAGNKVTLWDPESCALVGVLSPPVGLHPSESAVTRLVFSSRSPHLIGTTPRAVIVWDLLTSSVEWALPLHTSALVADPASSLFVVAVPAPRPPQQQQQQQQLSSRGRPKQQHHSRAGGAAAAGVAAAGQQQAGEQQGQEPEQEQSRSQQQEESKQGHKAAAAGQEGQRSSIVLAFTPSSAKPVLGTHISGTITPGLLFTAPGMPQYAAQVHAGGKDSASVTMSSLLVLREDRSYTYLGAVSPAAATKAGASQEQQQQQQQQEPQSRFEAAFGPAVAVSSAAQRAAEAGAGTAHDTLTRTQALFDAPSHVLPAPASLAQLYLQVLVGSAAS